MLEPLESPHIDPGGIDRIVFHHVVQQFFQEAAVIIQPWIHVLIPEDVVRCGGMDQDEPFLLRQLMELDRVGDIGGTVRAAVEEHQQGHLYAGRFPDRFRDVLEPGMFAAVT